MEIEYTNLYGKPLTAHQIASSDIFIKIFKENNRLRKKQYYENNTLFNELNYIELGTSHHDLLAQNIELLGIIEIEDIDTNYTKFHCFTYFNKILTSKVVEIELNGRVIMTQELNIETNIPIYNKTYKYYEDQNKDSEFEFKYYSSGGLASIIVSNRTTQFLEQYKINELDAIPNFEWWSQYSSYYLNAEPAIPNKIIIIV
ncbi:hypothetical protein GKZ90_0009135 [Flavobacterium sp. MC2016-06]|uniref:hypothetical protein n=1 Tax=Flavobacterium sp. MC2016-06 TaxID=2676308 RepID=UPI0012BA9B2C|nr:hypothetical protein [Flavobacterium sp. MC2016-06]MBU3859372.1 hypothetical protein [Flavobacterium sp. MC2016-06]